MGLKYMDPLTLYTSINWIRLKIYVLDSGGKNKSFLPNLFFIFMQYKFSYINQFPFPGEVGGQGIRDPFSPIKWVAYLLKKNNYIKNNLTNIYNNIYWEN